ncbi:hypothetical protein CGCF245_v015591 [Colletotrichum fructicola]|nr:hypothetical protein CGCF245_v015591 [Colletotrichum fructicola]
MAFRSRLNSLPGNRDATTGSGAGRIAPDRASPDLGSPVSPPPRPLPLCVDGLRDDAVEAYCKWYWSKVRSLNQKRYFELAYNLTIERGLDLELVHEDNDAQFFIQQGVLEGVARRVLRFILIRNTAS